MLVFLPAPIYKRLYVRDDLGAGKHPSPLGKKIEKKLSSSLPKSKIFSPIIMLQTLMWTLFSSIFEEDLEKVKRVYLAPMVALVATCEPYLLINLR